MIASIDTNVLVYVYDRRDPAKQVAAREIYATLAAQGTHRIALQVLGELYAVLTRKLHLSRPEAQAAVETLPDVFSTFTYELSDVMAALQLATEGVMSYWDGLLVSTSQQAGCQLLVSEDMQDGFQFGSMEIISPFVDGKVNQRLLELTALRPGFARP